MDWFFPFLLSNQQVYCNQVRLMTQGLRGRKKISTKFKYTSGVGKVKRRGFERRGQKRNRGKRGGEMRNGQEKRRRRRRRRRKEKKINLLLFWTDIEKKIIYITSWIPFVLLTQKSKKHKKFPFCRDVHLSMNQLLKAFYPSAGWFILVGREKKKTKTDGNM